LEMTAEDDPRRIEIVHKLASAVRQSEGSTVIPLLRKEAEGFRSRGDDVGLGAILVRLATALHTEGETAEAATMIDDGMRLLEGHAPGDSLAEAYKMAAGLSLLGGQSERSIPLAQRAIDFAEQLNLDGILARALTLLGSARCNLGDPAGIDDLRRSLEISLAAGDTESAGSAYINLGDVVWISEGPQAGLKVHLEGIDYCTRRGAIGSAMWARAETTWMLYDTGDWESLLSATDEVSRFVEKGGTGQTEAIALPFKALVLLLRGEIGASQRVIQDLLPRARRIGDPQVLGPALVAASQWEVSARNQGRALDLAKEFIQISTEPIYICWKLTDITRILASCDEIGLAIDLLERAGPSQPREFHSLQAAQAIVCEAKGDPVQALDRYLDSAERWAAFGLPIERGFSLMGAGRCHRALGRADQASARFEEARAIFGSLGALPLVAEVDALAP
ncbi:MAG TPA: tetratricopeptide repeat protein, partial [Actinomycetota bacterium]|nr:tetratricopeptide repeat protein [Actinomycetota bacterium]